MPSSRDDACCDRAIEGVRIHVDAVPGAELAIAGSLERRTRMDQREVDVEEDGLCHRSSSDGPATAIGGTIGMEDLGGRSRDLIDRHATG